MTCASLLAACSQAPEAPKQAAAPPAPAAQPAPAAPVALAPKSGVELQYVDNNVRVQDDFYRHVNGKWLDTFEIPADKPGYVSFNKVFDETQAHMRELVEAAAKGDTNTDANQKKIGDLYNSYMDEAKLELLGVTPMQADFAAIDAIKDKTGLATLMGNLGKSTTQAGSFGPSGTSLPFVTFVHQDNKDSTKYVVDFQQSGIGLPDRDYYLKDDDAKLKQMRADYLKHVEKMLALAGDKNAGKNAKDILALETELARVQWSRVENRDPVKTYNRFAVDSLAGVDARFAWPRFLAATGVAGRSAEVVVREPSFVAALADAIATTPLPVWKAYLRTRLLDAYAPLLGNDFVAARFAFAGTALSGTPENLARWRRGIALVQQSLGDALGRLYVARHHPARAQERMEALVDNLFAAYRESIASLDWMSEATKREATAKLAAFARKIGRPSRWIDYGALELRADDLVGNVVRARAFEHERQFARLGKPVDRDEWRITPQTVNAYYSASFNEIVFPAAILRPPFFDADADDAVNYGAIGAIIGHEISHGFDNRGSQYDGRGNLRVWWTEEDRRRFDAKTKVLVAQYSAFSPLAGQHVNGELTLGENIADNSGLEIAWKAYRRSLAGREAALIDGASGDQRFFYGYAQAMRSKSRDEALLMQIRSDPHSPAEARVNAAVRNHPAFHAAFAVRPGDGMYLAPEQRVSIW